MKMKLGNNDYALFAIKEKFNSGRLVNAYVPRMDGVVASLNGGSDLSSLELHLWHCAHTRHLSERARYQHVHGRCIQGPCWVVKHLPNPSCKSRKIKAARVS